MTAHVLGQVDACIFCGAVPTTREHLWPDWVRKELSIDERAMHVHRYGTKEEDVREDARLRPLYRPRLKIVCHGHNTGWMSALEKSVKPFALPLILGRGKELHSGGQTRLATWAILKTMVADFVGEVPRAVPVEHRQTLLASRGMVGPPPNVQVWIARYAGTRHPALASVRTIHVELTDPQGTVRDEFGYYATFSIEHLVVAVFGHAAPVPMEFNVGGGLGAALHPIWPIIGSFVFPSRPALTDAGLMALSRRSGGLKPACGADPAGVEWPLDADSRQSARPCREDAQAGRCGSRPCCGVLERSRRA